MSEEARSFFIECSELAVSAIRARLKNRREIHHSGGIAGIASFIVDDSCDMPMREGCTRLLVSKMPESHKEVQTLLSLREPKGIFDVQFMVFASLERPDFNSLEQDGIELMLVNYLQTVASSAGFAAWKAGLVLGSEWISERSLGQLVWLLSSAKYPAGRLGALNGLVWSLQHRKSYSKKDLTPIVRAVRTDSSHKVRSVAAHALKHWLENTDDQHSAAVKK